jgi:protein-L-isoaspartate O-methyltransferase
MPIGPESHQKLVRVWRRADNDFVENDFSYLSFVPLIDEHGWSAK